jgi:hypothetical protein
MGVVASVATAGRYRAAPCHTSASSEMSRLWNFGCMIQRERVVGEEGATHGASGLEGKNRCE